MAEEAVALEQPAPQEEVPQAPEEVPKSLWEQAGFTQELARVCTELEALDELDHLPPNIRAVVNLVSNAETVDEFDDKTPAQIDSFIRILQIEYPNVTSQIHDTVRRISRARTVVVDVDFI